MSVDVSHVSTHNISCVSEWMCAVTSLFHLVLSRLACCSPQLPDSTVPSPKDSVTSNNDDHHHHNNNCVLIIIIIKVIYFP